MLQASHVPKFLQKCHWSYLHLNNIIAAFVASWLKQQFTKLHVYLIIFLWAIKVIYCILFQFNIIIPISFALACVFLLVAPLFAAPRDTGMGCLITLTGIPVYLVGVAWKNKPKVFNQFVGMSDMILVNIGELSPLQIILQGEDNSQMLLIDSIIRIDQFISMKHCSLSDYGC